MALPNSARMLAGYCWKWISKNDSTKFDFELEDGKYRKQWNMATAGQAWITQNNHKDEIGCIHTSQGLELDYVGVIIGPDLIVRDGHLIFNVNERASGDKTVYTLRKKHPTKYERELAETIIRNTYRTLMTRGMKGCFIWAEDKETRDYFKGFAKFFKRSQE